MVEIAPAPRSEAEEIAQFMHRVFPKAKWGLDRWRALVDGRWGRPQDCVAITVRDKGDLVGVLGLVMAERPTSAGRIVTANMSSWYVLKPYRGGGIGRAMIDCATAEADVTVTNFSSSANAVSVVRRAGLDDLDDHRLLWSSTGTDGFPVHTAPLSLGADLPDMDREVLQAHDGLDLSGLTVETPDGLCTLILAVKRKSEAYVTHEVLFAGRRDLLAAHTQAIANSVLPEGPDARLSVDSRFLPPGTHAPATERFAVPRFCTPKRHPPEVIDFLYSEIVLLGLKLY